jgi:hypothetical protein
MNEHCRFVGMHTQGTQELHADVRHRVVASCMLVLSYMLVLGCMLVPRSFVLILSHMLVPSCMQEVTQLCTGARLRVLKCSCMRQTMCLMLNERLQLRRACAKANSSGRRTPDSGG